MYVSHQLAIADRRRGWTISIIIHALLLLLAFLPFIITQMPHENLSQAIAIQFEQNYFEESSTKMSGSEASSASAESEASSEVQTPREQVAVTSVSTIRPATMMPAPARSITTTEVNPEVFEPQTKANSSSDRFFSQPLVVVERNEVDRVEAFKEKPNPNLQQNVNWHISDSESQDQGAPTAFDFASDQGSGSGKTGSNGTGGSAPDGKGEDDGFNPFGDGSFPDGTGSGKGNAGKDTGVGQEGKGMHWGDFAGDGLFNRKVITRAPIKQIAELPGKIVINLCVDQLGKVVFAQFDSPNSTIRSKAISAKAEEYAKLYVFDEDPSAPREQCGRLTFIFEIKK